MSKTVHSRWRIIAIVLAFVALSLSVQLYQIRKSCENTFHYDFSVIVKDEQTGEELYSSVGSSSDSSQKIFNQTHSVSADRNRWEISGIAYEPKKFTFGAEGYHSESIMVTADTGLQLVIELEPKGEAKPNEKEN